eukprot:m.238855 g.238855  ORF g.238855 m.238855 type:complete len:152 (-) comp54363_c2_seq2:209-664(-)
MLMALFLSSPSLIARGTLPSFLPSFFSHLNPAPALLSRSPVIFSFDEVESFQKLALRVKDKSKFPMVVVGNKSDLVSERVISTTEASALAEKIGCPYIETSAKEARNIEEVFFEMVRVIRWFKNPSAGESYAPVSARGKKGGKDKGCCIVM